MIKLYCARLHINVKDDIERFKRIETFLNYLKGLEDNEPVYIYCTPKYYPWRWKKLRDVDTSIEELKRYELINFSIGVLEKNDELDFSQSIEFRIFDSSDVYVLRSGVTVNKDNVCLDHHRTLFDKFVLAGLIDGYSIY